MYSGFAYCPAFPDTTLYRSIFSSAQVLAGILPARRPMLQKKPHQGQD